MINYLLEATICWLLFYGVYISFLKKETFFHLNRYYLLGTLLGGLIIPLLEITPGSELAAQLQQAILLNEVVITGESTVIQATTQTANSLVFFLLYALIFVIMATRMLMGLSNIYRLKQQGTVIPEPHYTRIETTKPHAPFSFFRFLFLNRENGLSNTERNQIITHELAHIKGRHSVDVLLVELMTIILWFHPLIFLYKRSIKENHEFLADQAVLKFANKKQYSRLLVEQAIPGLRLANNFNHSLLKKRIKMMSTLKSNNINLLKYLICIPMIGLILFMFSCKKEVAEQLPQETAQKKITENDLSKVDKNSEKPATEHVDKAASWKELINSMKVNGNVDDSKRTEMIEAMEFGLNALEKQNTDKAHHEKLITQQFTTDQKINFIKKRTISSQLENDVYAVVEEMPRFPGCESGSMTNKQRKLCAEKLMLQFIYENIIYPEKARSNGIEGMAVASFTVNKQGNVTNPQILRGLEGGCNEEVLRIINQMPKWTPGKQQGKAVNVRFNLPIRFKLK